MTLTSVAGSLALAGGIGDGRVAVNKTSLNCQYHGLKIC